MKSFRTHISALAIILVIVPELGAQSPGLSGVNVVFQRVSTEQGLSNNSVWAITQDMQGFIWFGTSNGLNRFDGKQCVVYHARPDSTGLSNDGVLALYADRDTSVWIGTEHGLNRFDPSTRTFKKYLHDPRRPTSLSSNKVRSIYRDRTGVLWVGTAWGLNRFESSTNGWVRSLPNAADSTKPGENCLDAILEDSRGVLWIGTGHYMARGGGLFQYDRNNGRFIRYIVVKHAAASEVRIEVVTKEKMLEIQIQDNGRGFVTEEKADAGNGLGSMKKRMLDIGGRCLFESGPGRGTTVKLSVNV